MRIDALEAFARSVAHDLRNPLFAVDGVARMMLQSPASALTRDDRENLICISRGATQMSGMLEGLRALTGVAKEAPMSEPVDLAAIARDVADGLAYRYRHRDVAFSVGELPPLQSDPRMLRVVLQNLIENAWKYTARTAQARVEVGGLANADGGVTYFVRDNGAGFYPADAARIFLPFKQPATVKSAAGRGVGLATVKRVIDKLDGRVWAQGEPGQGATFYFQLGK